MAFANNADRQKAYDLFSQMTWNDREACGYTQPLMSYSNMSKDISSITEYTTRKAYDGAKKSITVTTILMYVSIGGALALVSTALAQRACLLPWDGNALEYVLFGTILAIIAYMIYALKRSFSTTIRIYEENIKIFETPDELIERMSKHVDDVEEQKAEKEEHTEIDELNALIAKAHTVSSASSNINNTKDDKNDAAHESLDESAILDKPVADDSTDIASSTDTSGYADTTGSIATSNVHDSDSSIDKSDKSKNETSNYDEHNDEINDKNDTENGDMKNA